MKQKKLYAVKEERGKIWKMELDINKIAEICHEGAGSEMDDDRITIVYTDSTWDYVDKIISE